MPATDAPGEDQGPGDGPSHLLLEPRRSCAAEERRVEHAQGGEVQQQDRDARRDEGDLHESLQDLERLVDRLVVEPERAERELRDGDAEDAGRHGECRLSRCADPANAGGEGGRTHPTDDDADAGEETRGRRAFACVREPSRHRVQRHARRHDDDRPDRVPRGEPGGASPARSGRVGGHRRLQDEPATPPVGGYGRRRSRRRSWRTERSPQEPGVPRRRVPSSMCGARWESGEGRRRAPPRSMPRERGR
jgi:hypothetical protein